MTAFVIDTFEFSRLKERQEGALAVADFARLAEETADASGRIEWVVQGGSHAQGYPQLHMAVKAECKLMCQRCLTPFTHTVESETLLVLARDDEAADELEEKLADEDLDVIVGAKNMNVLELVEDEVLLSIPLSPKHDICPDQVGQDAGQKEGGAADKRVSPFAVLKGKQ